MRVSLKLTLVNYLTTDIIIPEISFLFDCDLIILPGRYQLKKWPKKGRKTPSLIVALLIEVQKNSVAVVLRFVHITN